MDIIFTMFLIWCCESCRSVDLLALLVQQVEERRGLLADEVEAAAVVDVVDVVPGDALGPVLLLQDGKKPQAWLGGYITSDCCCRKTRWSDAAESLGSE